MKMSREKVKMVVPDFRPRMYGRTWAVYDLTIGQIPRTLGGIQRAQSLRDWQRARLR